jgi:hypothetical protein
VRILILGDYYDIDDRQAAEQATYKLGQALATAGNELIACTDNLDTADYQFVLGARESGSTDFSLTIYSPAQTTYPFEAQLKGCNFRTSYQVSPFADWEIVHMEVIQYADIILLVGGSGQWHYVTKMLGLASIALRKIVVPIACFGGEARNVWDSLATSPMRHDYETIGLDITQLNRPWRDETTAHISGMVSEAFSHRLMVFNATKFTRANSLAKSLLVALGLFGTTAGAWVYLLTKALNATYPLSISWLFILVVLAGGIGSGANTIYSLWRGEGQSFASQILSLLVGVSGGLISFVLYLFAQLLFSSEVVTELEDPAAMMRSALFASFFGIFAGLFIDRGYDLIRRTSETILGGIETKK